MYVYSLCHARIRTHETSSTLYLANPFMHNWRGNSDLTHLPDNLNKFIQPLDALSTSGFISQLLQEDRSRLRLFGFLFPHLSQLPDSPNLPDRSRHRDFATVKSAPDLRYISQKNVILSLTESSEFWRFIFIYTVKIHVKLQLL